MQLLSDDAEDWERSDCKDHAENRIAALCSTSGTTGMPKMAARSHSSLTVETQAIIEGEAPKPYKVRSGVFKGVDLLIVSSKTDFFSYPSSMPSLHLWLTSPRFETVSPPMSCGDTTNTHF